MKVAVASDHAGFRYKALLARHLAACGHEVVDFGTSSSDPVDYPDFIRLAANAVASGRCERGIVLGGSGNGEAIAAIRIVDLWLTTPFEGGRHVSRNQKLDTLP